MENKEQQQCKGGECTVLTQIASSKVAEYTHPCYGRKGSIAQSGALLDVPKSKVQY